MEEPYPNPMVNMSLDAGNDDGAAAIPYVNPTRTRWSESGAQASQDA